MSCTIETKSNRHGLPVPLGRDDTVGGLFCHRRLLSPGAKTESESVKNDLATIIQELINNGALDLSSFNG